MTQLLDATTANSAARSGCRVAERRTPPAAPQATAGPKLFVVGADRSGTTMLRLILNRHSELAIPPESHFLAPLLDALPRHSKLTDAQVTCAAEIITQCKSFSTWHTTNRELEEAFRAQPDPTLATLVDAAFRREIAATGKPHWGDKTPAYAVLVQPLHELFPQAQFVHIVRDGRDVSISLKNRQWRGWTEYQRARYWSHAVRTADDAGRRIGPSGYLRVSYDDLVLSCESTVRGLCDFLHIAFEPAMLTFHQDAMQHIADFEQHAGIHEKLVRAPRSCDVGRWRRESSAARVWVFEAIAGRTMEQVGITRRYQGAARWLGAVASLPYRVIGASAGCVQRLFDRLPASIQDGLRQNRLLRRLKQASCRC